MVIEVCYQTLVLDDDVRTGNSRLARHARSLARLRSETRAWTARANRRHAPICWEVTRKDARKKFGDKYKLSTRSET